jgi:uncharacterized protein (TIGR00251 family)
VSSPAETPWLVPVDGGVVVRVHARPGRSRSRIVGLHGDALKIELHARPVEGAANRELIAVLADALAVRPATLEVTAGARGREKRIRASGLDPDTARTRLARFVDKPQAPD